MINSPNFIPIVAGIIVNVSHAVDAVEVVLSRTQVGDDIPFSPRTIADGSDSGAGVGSGEVGDLTRVSNVELSILTKR